MDDDRVQLYVTRRGTTVIRRLPRNEPSAAQQEVQRRFGEAARSAAGRRMSGRLPPAAESVQSALTGTRVTTAIPEPGWVRVLRAWLRGRGYTEAQAEAIVAALAR